MVRKIALSALIAALYAGLTFILIPISYGPVQFRVAEALTLLPFCMPEAIPGLFIGCMLSNFWGGFGLIDVVLGSTATLIAAWLTWKMPNIWLAAVPPVVVNATIVGTYLGIITEIPIPFSISYIGLSQAVICFAIGVPLCKIISKTPGFNSKVLSKKEKAPGVWVEK